MHLADVLVEKYIPWLLLERKHFLYLKKWRFADPVSTTVGVNTFEKDER